ncbi:MAG: ATP-binding protein, partial [Pseudomonadota bacterium]
MKQELIILAETAKTEDEQVEFKREFAPEKRAEFWSEIVKDIIAIANTNGGAIVFGIEDNGEASG